MCTALVNWTTELAPTINTSLHKLHTYSSVRGQNCSSFMTVCPPPSSGALPWQNHAYPWQPRVATDHTGVWVLWRVSPKVRLGDRVEVLHRDLRLLVPLRHHWWKGGCRPLAGLTTWMALGMKWLNLDILFLLLLLLSNSNDCFEFLGDDVNDCIYLYFMFCMPILHLVALGRCTHNHAGPLVPVLLL